MRLVAAGLLALLASCDDEENRRSPVVVEFGQEELVITENAEENLIELGFNTSPDQNGEIEIAVSNEMAKYFTTTPATVNGKLLLPVRARQASASFTVAPVDDPNINQDRRIEFSIDEVSEDLLIGDKKRFFLNIRDDEAPSPQSVASFIPANANISEKYVEGYALRIHLTESSTVNGSVVVKTTSNKAVYGEHFITEPESSNGELTLAVTSGTSVASFRVVPIDNAIITGEFELQFTIINTAGNIRKGTTLKENLKISDDELTNKPKGYEVAGGNWGLRRTIEYDAIGRIHQVHIETATPAKSTRTETYFYNSAGQLEKINEYPNINKVFTWSNDRIIKSEKINHGVLKAYTLYDYDNVGHVSGTATYYLQADGQFKLGTLLGYLYFNDGNLYKALTYAPGENGGEPILLSTRTWENYLDAENPFPMVDLLPNVKTQLKLPSTYRIEENGHDILYNLSYEFRTDGLVGKRTTNGPQVSEVALYHYY